MTAAFALCALCGCCALLGCFDPSIRDGAIACGDAGCPPGMTCAADSVCRTTEGDTSDVVLVTARDGETAELFASCDGEVRLAWQLGGVKSGRSVAWGAGDADHQVLALGSLGDDLRVYSIHGDAIDETASSSDLHNVRSVEWADYDRDGRLDLAIADADLSLEVLVQKRDALDDVWRAADMVDPWGVAWGDLDGDGDPDLAVGSVLTTAVYRNDGGVLTRAWTSPRVEETRGLGFADLNGDGHLDLVTGALAGPVRVFSGDGHGGFTETWTSKELGAQQALAFGDYDGDGDLDLAVAGRDQPSHVYRNDGGTLVLAWSTPASQTTWGVSWFDVDGDGDLDLTLGNHDQKSRVYRNDGGTLVDWLTLDVDQVRELAWARWPVAAGAASACDVVRWRAGP